MPSYKKMCQDLLEELKKKDSLIDQLTISKMQLMQNLKQLQIDRQNLIDQLMDKQLPENIIQ